MMDLKTLIAKTAIDPDLTRVKTACGERSAKQSQMGIEQFLTHCQSDGAWYSLMTR